MVELGDFSRALTDRWAGVLYQQGRVSLDTDGTAQTMITVDWQDAAASDIIGVGEAAIPADERDGFLVETASIVNGAVVLGVQPGRAWVNGRVIRLDATAPVERRATYLGPPLHDPLPTADSITAGVRDAVLLEVWREAINGFQLPDELIEPALGGPDTTERLSTSYAFRLLRLDAGETCETVSGRLFDDRSMRGRLTVTLEPETVIAGDCPVVEGGGYSGFEHSLIRIEIAATDAGPDQFKWSQFNGGLVGRALFDGATRRATITANLAAISASGLGSFYLEAITYDQSTGNWAVAYGAPVTLNAENRLVLPATPTFGAVPDGSASVFIRLWNGLEQLDAFPAAAGPTPFRDGIHLAFDPPGPSRRYLPGDYWTFPVRAGDVENVGPFPTDAPPDGPRFERVALAILEWNGTATIDRTNAIDDCRRIFNPLTRLGTCCTYRVGDGLQSHGEFDSIQEAVDHLPPEGGEICVLPGTYEENVRLVMRNNVTISGCTGRSVVTGVQVREGEPDPVFHVVNSRGVKITGLAVRARPDGIGILVEDTVPEILDRGRDVGSTGATRDISLADLLVFASSRPAIEVHGARNVTIREDVIEMADVRTTWPAIYFQGEDGLIERNVVRVARRVPIDRLPVGNLEREFLIRPLGVAPILALRGGLGAASISAAALSATAAVAPMSAATTAATAAVSPGSPAAASLRTHLEPAAAVLARPPIQALVSGPGLTARLGLGGIQLGGLSERVRVSENLIQGGAGNGITLGSVRHVNRQGIDLRRRLGWIIDVDADDDGSPCLPGRIVVVDPPDDAPPDVPIAIPAGSLRDIVIERNRIFDAGLNGIGVVGFFRLTMLLGFRRIVSVQGLRIDDNEIRRCLSRPVASAGERSIETMGFGGISLADADGLTIRRNVIEDNGPDYLDPVCGIFMLHGEGVEIADNRIVNNGSPTSDPPANARPGRRGGIHIVLCSAPLGATNPDLARLGAVGRQDGTAALRVRDNVVSATLGQALVATANGPVVVHGNTFTSLGVVPRPEPLRRGLFGATVTILNLGRSAEHKTTPRYFKALSMVLSGTVFKLAADPSKVTIDRGLRPEGIETEAIASGMVLFSDNQCLFLATLLRPPDRRLMVAPGLAGVLERFAPAATTPVVAGPATGAATMSSSMASTAAVAGAAGPTVAGAGSGAVAAGPLTAGGPAGAAGTLAAAPAVTAGGLTGGVASGLAGARSGIRGTVAGASAYTEFIKDSSTIPALSAIPIGGIVEALPYRPIAPDVPEIVGPAINPGALLPVELGLRLSSISILSLDDVGVHDNQCLTTLPEGTLLTQLFAYGDSVRATGNRLKEGPGDAVFSAITLGGTNVTAHNEATHCLVVRPSPPSDRVIDGPNIIVVTGADRAYCQRFATVFGDFGRLGG